MARSPGVAEAEIDELLNKKYADLESEFSALLGSAVLAPTQAYEEVMRLAPVSARQPASHQRG